MAIRQRYATACSLGGFRLQNDAGGTNEKNTKKKGISKDCIQSRTGDLFRQEGVRAKK